MAVEKLEAEISLTTHEAFANLSALTGALDKTADKLDNTAKATEKLDKKLDDAAESVADATKKVEDFEKNTAKAADTTEDLSKKVEDTGKSAKMTAGEVDRLTTGIQASSKATDALSQAKEKYGIEAEAASKKAAKGVAAENDLMKQLAEAQLAAKTGNTAVLDSTSNIVSSLGTWAASLSAVVASYMSFNTVLKVLDEIDERQRRIVQTRNELVAGRLSLDQQLQTLLFNLKIPQTVEGAQQGRDIIKEFMKISPAASTGTVISVLGAGGSYGFNPADKNDKAVLGNVASFSARLGFDDETSGKIMQLMAAANKRTPDQVNPVLGMLEAAAQTSPVEKPADFMRSFLRAVLPLVQGKGGLDIPTAAGVFNASAIGDTEPRVAATNVEQFFRVVGGKSEKEQAAIFRQAIAAGRVSTGQVNDLIKKATGDMPEKVKNRLGELDTIISNSTADIKKENEDFAADIDIKNKELKALDTRRVNTEAQATSQTLERQRLNNEIKSRQTSHDTRLRTLNQRISETAESKKLTSGEQQTKSEDAEFAKAYRSLPRADRFALFNSLARQAQGKGQLGEFLTQVAGATSEETNAANTIYEAGGTKQAQDTVAAMRSSNPADTLDANKKFEETNIGQDTAQRNRDQMREAESVGSVEQFQTMIESEAKSRAKIITVKGLRPAQLFGNEEDFQLLVERDEVMRQYREVLKGMTDEESKIFDADLKILNQFAEAINVGTNSTTTLGGMLSATNNFIAAIFSFGAKLADWRKANPRSNRTPRGGKNVPERFRMGKGDTWRDIPSMPPIQFRGTTGGATAPGGVDGSAGSPKPRAAAPAASVGASGGAEGPDNLESVASAIDGSEGGGAGGSDRRTYYNVSIGQVFSQGGTDDLSFTGRLEGNA